MATQQKTVDEKIDDLAIAVKKGFDSVDERFNKVDERFNKVEGRLDIIENKLDRALNRQLDKHEHWIKLIADKVGVRLE